MLHPLLNLPKLPKCQQSAEVVVKVAEAEEIAVDAEIEVAAEADKILRPEPTQAVKIPTTKIIIVLQISLPTTIKAKSLTRKAPGLPQTSQITRVPAIGKKAVLQLIVLTPWCVVGSISSLQGPTGPERSASLTSLNKIIYY